MSGSGNGWRRRLDGWTKALSRDETARLRRMLAPFPRSCRVVEVGSGLGRKLLLLRDMGFTDLCGIERNPDVAQRARDKGLHVLSPEGAEPELLQRPADLLLLSHVVEHFAWDGLSEFMNHYLNFLRVGGHCCIVSPLAHDRFWIDFDHVKPYPPQAIKLFFGENDEQVQAYSPHTLKLRDVDFRRSPWRITYSRALLLKKGDLAPRLANLALAAAFRVSGKLLGRTTGWLGLFEKTR
ncbi:methyltransferase type 12 [Desulfovibrio sp. X2]|uniref:methyltransferase domain-containing protein n=1 Tax=Desulfovibrio sp. X2 TaxID=941449 RepID=UPI000358AAB5|nr:methyltransferase domain-containing protein [Desulfovibrio sp. X2]EPR44119.1 methyltransferase type 12 [Desulfovibrio sp. X2]